jgi:hypothetical protein
MCYFYRSFMRPSEDVGENARRKCLPEFEEVSGVAEIREISGSSKFGNVAGVIKPWNPSLRNAKARVIRDVGRRDNPHRAAASFQGRRHRRCVRTSRLVSSLQVPTTSRWATRSRRPEMKEKVRVYADDGLRRSNQHRGGATQFRKLFSRSPLRTPRAVRHDRRKNYG